MNKVLQLKIKDKTGQLKDTGKIEIKNSNEEKAELYFYGDIVSDTWSSWWVEEDKCPQDVSNFLKELDNSKDLNIYINSGGGSVFGGIAIYNMLKRHKGQKTVHVDGLAASIASVIALAGDKVIIPKNSQFMIHNPLCFLCDSYNASDLNKIANSLDNCKESILNIYLDHAKSNITKDKLSEMMGNETWLTGEQASEYFNIEVENETELVACASDYFDKYKNIPKHLNKKERISINTEEITDKILQIIENKKELKEKELKDNIEKEKQELLEDLDLY